VKPWRSFLRPDSSLKRGWKTPGFTDFVEVKDEPKYPLKNTRQKKEGDNPCP
jgi:hypothetical protein